MGIKKNFIYNTFNQLLLLAIPIITTPYVSRILGAQNIGIYSYTYSIASYFALFILLGLSNYGNREIAKVRDNKAELRKTFSEIYAMQLIIGITILLLYIIFVSFVVTSDKAIFMLQIVYVLGNVIDINWALYGLELFKETSIRSTIIKTISLICIFLFVKNSTSLAIYTLILALESFVTQLYSWLVIRKKIRFIKVSWKGISKHIKPNLILFIPVIAVSLYKIMDKIMLGMLSNMIEVGYYESSEKIIKIPMALITSLGTVMLPRMSNLYAKHDTKQSNHYIEKSLLFAMIVAPLLCFGIMGVAKEFVPFYYGNGYDKCIQLYQCLLPSCVFLAFSNVIRTQYLIPYHKDKIFIKAVILGAIVNVTCNLILIPSMQSMGAALGTLIAEATVCIYQTVMVRRELNIKKYIKNSIPFIFDAIIMYSLLYTVHLPFLNIVNIIIKALFGSIIYISLAATYLKLKYNR